MWPPALVLADLKDGRPTNWASKCLDQILFERIVSLENIRDSADYLNSIGSISLGTWLRTEASRRTHVSNEESGLEIRFSSWLSAMNLHDTVTQLWINAAGGPYRLDMALSLYRIAIEVDSFSWHTGRTSFDEDRRRDAALMRVGWLTLRFTDRTTETDFRETVEAAVGQR